MTLFRRLQLEWRAALSPAEAAEVATRVAELSKPGLPLGPGLRALADELSGRRLSRVLRAVADRVDRGGDLLAAFESQGTRLPTHLRGLMLAGLRRGRLPEVLEEYVDLQRGQAELRRRVALSLAYPFILLVFLTGLAVIARLCVVGTMTEIFAEFGVGLPAITILVVKLWGPLMWSLVGLLGLSVSLALLAWAMPEPHWIWPVPYRVPMLGPLLRFSHLVRFSRLMALLVEQRNTSGA